MTSRVTRLLAAQHEEILAMLRACRTGRDGIDLQCFDAFRHALLRHVAVEERVLMPALTRKLGKAPVFQNALRKDHAGFAALCVATPNREWLDDLEGLLAHHQGVEEAPGGFHALVDTHLGGDPHLFDEVSGYPALTLPPLDRGPRVRELLKEVHALLGLPP